MNRCARRGNLWTIVLAGGDGMRTKEFIQHRLGYDKPKQYCAFVGNRSMFQHTLDRAVRVTPWERVVVVAARHHQNELWQQLDGRPAGMVLLQPRNVEKGRSFHKIHFPFFMQGDGKIEMKPCDRQSSEFLSSERRKA